MNLILLFMIFRSCKECIYIRQMFPKKYKCIYFDIPITEFNNNNCSKYKLKNLNW